MKTPVIAEEEYNRLLEEIDILMRKEEGNLTAQELSELIKKADLVEAFEEAHNMVPDVRKSRKTKK
jgi:hypothetical protein